MVRLDGLLLHPAEKAAVGPAADFRAAEFRGVRAQEVGVGFKDPEEFRELLITLRKPPAVLQIGHSRVDGIRDVHALAYFS